MRNRIYKIKTGHRGNYKLINPCQIKQAFLAKSCIVCGKTITRKINDSGRVESLQAFSKRKTCGYFTDKYGKLKKSECAKTQLLAEHNPNYKGLMPKCRLCGKKTSYLSKNTKGRFCIKCFNQLRTGVEKKQFSSKLNMVVCTLS